MYGEQEEFLMFLLYLVKHAEKNLNDNNIEALPFNLANLRNQLDSEISKVQAGSGQSEIYVYNSDTGLQRLAVENLSQWYSPFDVDEWVSYWPSSIFFYAELVEVEV